MKTRKFSPIIPLIGLFSCLGLLVFLSPNAWLIGLAGLAVGFAYYFARRKHGAKQPKAEA